MTIMHFIIETVLMFLCASLALFSPMILLFF